jgi:protocatechuate 3,4-dioxygenase beta subunit
VPNTPERTVVGKGHVLTGIALSSADCQPIAGAKLEFWPEEEEVGHPDSSRATFFTDQGGRYRFECNQPEHIHMRVSAEGYRTIGVNSYHPNGQADGTFDIVLQLE